MQKMNEYTSHGPMRHDFDLNITELAESALIGACVVSVAFCAAALFMVNW